MDGWVVVTTQNGEVIGQTVYAEEKRAVTRAAQAVEHYKGQGFKEVSPGVLRRRGDEYRITVESGRRF